MKHFFTLCPLFVLLVGCIEQSGTTESTIPDATIECSQAAVSSNCRSTGERLWIGLTKTFEMDCGSVLSSFSSQTRNSKFDAYAENISVTQSGILVRATVSSWLSPYGGTQASLPAGSYKVCAFIEDNGGNQRLDLGEPLGAGLFEVGGESPQLVNDWISY